MESSLSLHTSHVARGLSNALRLSSLAGVRKAILVVFGLFAAFVLMEVTLRSARYWRDGTFQAENTYDPDLGWVPTPNYARRTRRPGRGHYSTNALGARMWGSHPGSPRILFVGDSFTQASDVSNDETYYARFARLSGLDTYAIGASGYGTLQERKLLERVLRVSGLRPDVFVLQFCGNDFVDNSPTLERESIAFAQRIRPYRDLARGDVYTLGNNRLFVAALRWSAVFRSALTLTENVLYRTRHGYYLDLLPREVKAAAYDESVHVTGVLLAEMRRLVQGSAYAFNCQDDKLNTFDQSAAFAALARAAGFTPLVGARRFVENGPGGAAGVLAADGGHLNAVGHQRLAGFLFREICHQETCASRSANAAPDAPTGARDSREDRQTQSLHIGGAA